MDPSKKSKLWSRLLVPPALAIVLTACSGSEQPVETAGTVADPVSAEESESNSGTETAPTDLESSSEDTEPQAPAEEQAQDEPTASPVEQLSADVAIANAEANIGNLATPQSDDSVLDIEVLAVGDGSIQTLGDVIVGDRPVLLWFFSPH